MQTVQNRCIRYSLQLDNRSHIGMKNFEKKLTGSRFLKDLISTFVLTLLNFLRKLVLYIFMIYIDNLVKIKQTRDLYPLRNTCSGQKNLSYLTPIVWNSLPTHLKLANSLNNFKHKLKDRFFKKLRNMDIEQNIFAY